MKQLKLYKYSRCTYPDPYSSIRTKTEEVTRDYIVSDYVKHLLVTKRREYSMHPLNRIEQHFNNFAHPDEGVFKCPIITTTKIGLMKHIPVIDVDRSKKLGISFDDIKFRLEAFGDLKLCIWSSGTEGHYWIFLDKIGSMFSCKRAIELTIGLTIGSAIADRNYAYSVNKFYPVRATPNVNGCPHELYRSENLTSEFENWINLFRDHYNSPEIQNLNEYLVSEWI